MIMKNNLFYKLFVFCLFITVVSCNSEDVLDETDQNQVGDSVEVDFNITGIDVEEMPISRGEVADPKTYYYIQILSHDAVEEGDYFTPIELGFLGFFSDLKYAHIRLARGGNYKIRATALIERKFLIDPESFSTVMQNITNDKVHFYNEFSEYLISQGKYYWIGGGSPTCPDSEIDRYFKEEMVTVNSNETINIELKRLVYGLTCEIDPPAEGHICLSCDAPKFEYSVGTNEKHFSKSVLYSFGGYEVNNPSRVITLKLEYFDNKGVSTGINTKELTIKPNVNYIVKVHFDPKKADNFFGLTLETAPTIIDEEFIW